MKVMRVVIWWLLVPARLLLVPLWSLVISRIEPCGKNLTGPDCLYDWPLREEQP